MNSSRGVLGRRHFSTGARPLNNCIVAGNSAHYAGGGLMNVDGTLTVSDSQVSDNSALAGGVLQ